MTGTYEYSENSVEKKVNLFFDFVSFELAMLFSCRSSVKSND